jgi:methylase of polypeptide subunit release factors
LILADRPFILHVLILGFQKVYGTDANPNAIVGLKDFMGEIKLSRKIDLHYGNLFAMLDKETELIAFNPP